MAVVRGERQSSFERYEERQASIIDVLKSISLALTIEDFDTP